MESDVAAAILVQMFFNAHLETLGKNTPPEKLAEQVRPYFLEFRKMVESQVVK